MAILMVQMLKILDESHWNTFCHRTYQLANSLSPAKTQNDVLQKGARKKAEGRWENAKGISDGENFRLGQSGGVRQPGGVINLSSE